VSTESAVSPGVHSAPRELVFYAPGLRTFKTSEYAAHDAGEFVSISVTGDACALGCDHCDTAVLRGMTALPRARGSLFELCAEAHARGARGVLVSGGCDRTGRVPLLAHADDLRRARSELGLTIRVHPGLPDEATCKALAAIGIDGAMVDIIGHADTIRSVYHLDASVADYESALERLGRHGVPAVPHIVLGLHYGTMLGEWTALDIVARHPRKLLVLVVLMPLSGTGMALVQPPAPDALGAFFRLAREKLPDTRIVLGCARPMGRTKLAIDRHAIDAGLDGVAYPAEGTVTYAREQGHSARFINACCGVGWP